MSYLSRLAAQIAPSAQSASAPAPLSYALSKVCTGSGSGRPGSALKYRCMQAEPKEGPRLKKARALFRDALFDFYLSAGARSASATLSSAMSRPVFSSEKITCRLPLTAAAPITHPRIPLVTPSRAYSGRSRTSSTRSYSLNFSFMNAVCPKNSGRSAIAFHSVTASSGSLPSSLSSLSSTTVTA